MHWDVLKIFIAYIQLIPSTPIVLSTSIAYLSYTLGKAMAYLVHTRHSHGIMSSYPGWVHTRMYTRACTHTHTPVAYLSLRQPDSAIANISLWLSPRPNEEVWAQMIWAGRAKYQQYESEAGRSQLRPVHPFPQMFLNGTHFGNVIVLHMQPCPSPPTICFV